MLATNVNYVAVLAAAAAGWAFGAIWYRAFAARWAAALGKTTEQLTLNREHPIATLTLSFVAKFVMAAVLAHLIAGLGPVSIGAGLVSAAVCWLGFVLTTTIVNNIYAGNRFALIGVASWHQMGVLLVMGAVIGAFGK
jgi:hypothetical protein